MPNAEGITRRLLTSDHFLVQLRSAALWSRQGAKYVAQNHKLAYKDFRSCFGSRVPARFKPALHILVACELWEMMQNPSFRRSLMDMVNEELDREGEQTSSIGQLEP